MGIRVIPEQRIVYCDRCGRDNDDASVTFRRGLALGCYNDVSRAWDGVGGPGRWSGRDAKSPIHLCDRCAEAFDAFMLELSREPAQQMVEVKGPAGSHLAPATKGKK